MEDAADLFAIGVQECPRRFGRQDVKHATLGDVAPLEVVRAQPVADDNVRALLIQGGGDVGADEARAPRDHIHARPPSLSPSERGPISKLPFGAAVPLTGSTNPETPAN